MADSPRIQELRRRVQTDPASIAFAALAEEYRRGARFEEAIETCTIGLQRHPSYLSARVTLGRALLEVGRYDEAQQELEYVLTLAPENLAAIRGLAEIHHRRGDDTHDHDRLHAAIDTARAEAAVEQKSRDMPPVVPIQVPSPVRADLPLNGPEPRSVSVTDMRFERDVPAAVPADLAIHTHARVPAEDRALAGLEDFLAAIRRVKAR